MPGKARGSKVRGQVFGTSSRASSVKWDRDTLSWRTCEPSLLEESTKFSGRWPTSGTMRSGQLYEHPTLVPRTDASASSSSHGFKEWQTPVADDSVDRLAGKVNSRGEPKLSAEVLRAWPTPVVNMGRSRTAGRSDPNSAHHDGETIHDAVQTWATPRSTDGTNGSRTLEGTLKEVARGLNQSLPMDVTAWATPTTRDHKGTGDLSNSMVRQDGTPRDDTVPRQAFTWAGPTPSPSVGTTEPSDSSPPKPRGRGLNPRFSLWLMGFPVAWLDSEPPATRLSRRARKSSGGGSLK